VHGVGIYQLLRKQTVYFMELFGHLPDQSERNHRIVCFLLYWLNSPPLQYQTEASTCMNVVDKVALKQALLQVLWFLCQFHSTNSLYSAIRHHHNTSATDGNIKQCTKRQRLHKTIQVLCSHMDSYMVVTLVASAHHTDKNAEPYSSGLVCWNIIC